MTEAITMHTKPAGLFRRLFAIFYDIFLLTAILLILAAIAMAINHGDPIEANNSFRPLYVFIMTGACYLYFAWFWINGGQTLGMKTWQIQLEYRSAEQITPGQINWKIAGIRFCGAIVSWGIFGLGFLWSLFDKDKRCWHDIISNTFVIDLRQQ